VLRLLKVRAISSAISSIMVHVRKSAAQRRRHNAPLPAAFAAAFTAAAAMAARPPASRGAGRVRGAGVLPPQRGEEAAAEQQLHALGTVQNLI
jgi:hypothetical protein